jgi:Amt family ammonium transporter
MAVFAFLIGVLIYPLYANWVWGGGWLAELGREYGLGHGFVDLAGAGVVHETAGTLALVIAIVLGPRTDRFGLNKKAIPGHNMPFVLLGTILLLISWTATNAFADEDPTAMSTPIAGLAAVNTLLAASSGLFASLLLSGWLKQRPSPALLCRGLLGGAVASCGCSSLIDPWAAFVIGGLAGLFVQGATGFFAYRRIDDPVGAAATHGIGGAWGVIATGLFANGLAGKGLNGVDGTVRGLFYGGAWHQLLTQIIGAVTSFVVVFILGYASLILVQKILGLRVPLADETEGLDWPQTGALGYQADAEPDSKN